MSLYGCVYKYGSVYDSCCIKNAIINNRNENKDLISYILREATFVVFSVSTAGLKKWL